MLRKKETNNAICFKLLFSENLSIHRLLINWSQWIALRSMEIPGMHKILNWSQSGVGVPLDSLQSYTLLIVALCLYSSLQLRDVSHTL